MPDGTQSISSVGQDNCSKHLVSCCCFLGLLFDTEDGGSEFLRKACKLSTFMVTSVRTTNPTHNCCFFNVTCICIHMISIIWHRPN
jgi:hypothetical protein